MKSVFKLDMCTCRWMRRERRLYHFSQRVVSGEKETKNFNNSFVVPRSELFHPKNSTDEEKKQKNYKSLSLFDTDFRSFSSFDSELFGEKCLHKQHKNVFISGQNILLKENLCHKMCFSSDDDEKKFAVRPQMRHSPIHLRWIRSTEH